MLLYGASGHAKVIIDILHSQKIEVSFIFDDDPLKSTLLDYKITHPYDSSLFSNDDLIISIGDNLTRKKKAESISHKFGIAIHSSAIISDYASISKGTVVMHGAIIQSGTEIGTHVIINTSSSIDHDCIIGDYAHISPKAVLCGNVKVGEGTHVGAGAVVIPNVTIGKWATIGAGSVIISNIPDYSVVVGNPGNIIKYKN